MDIYTYENWQALKPSDLTNQAIADIIGTTANNVGKQLRAGKKLPTWARAMVWVWSQKPIEDLVLEARAAIEANKEPINPDDKIYPCGCLFQDGLFRRGSDCKIPKENHT